MRVLLDVSAVPARPVGAGVYTVALASGLARHVQVELVLLARQDDAERWSALAPRAEVHAVAPRRRPARLAWEQTSAARLASRTGVDVWHGPHYTMPLRVGVPAVVTMHDLTFFDHPEWHERSKVLFFRRMIAASARRAAVCVCVSHHTERRLRAVARPAGETVVIHHGVDHDRFRPDAPARSASPTDAGGAERQRERPTEPARSASPTDAGGAERQRERPMEPAGDDAALLRRQGIEAPYVAFTGTIEPRKDVPGLVAAFARTAATRPDLRLVLVGGDGWGVGAARAAVAASGVATRVLRAGYLAHDALPAFLRQAELAAYPSLEEGFGLPALEALACGTPLVTTTGSAMEELVGDAALLVPPGDTDALAAAMTRALDPAVAARLRAAGPTRAARFTWEASVDAHVDAYDRARGARAAA